MVDDTKEYVPQWPDGRRPKKGDVVWVWIPTYHPETFEEIAGGRLHSLPATITGTWPVDGVVRMQVQRGYTGSPIFAETFPTLAAFGVEPYRFQWVWPDIGAKLEAEAIAAEREKQAAAAALQAKAEEEKAKEAPDKVEPSPSYTEPEPTPEVVEPAPAST